jgi:hypothetical protein
MEKINRIFLEKFDDFKKVIELISYSSINDVNLVTKDIKKCRFTNTTLIFSDGTSEMFVPFYSHGTCGIDFATVNVIKLRDSKDNILGIHFVSSQDADNFVAELAEF